eukprot:CAMPEP_0181435700 /NCGR_PEP_ID=MMETSP1110-20121109/20469_1 /TAXON_ID=174948 /ORGANISM="Symbiodinium sp., Strain CCMP421" /LENGTH=91 /DNA_ID=CAMNT_0023559245 /DNA_START=532 /DNA_END=807 /DNA_ORIENTATION=-
MAFGHVWTEYMEPAPGVPSLEVGILSLSAPAVPDVPGILDGQSGRSGHGRSAQGEAAKFHLEKGAKCLPSTVAFLHLGPSFRSSKCCTSRE